MKAGVIDYRMGNLASVSKALEASGWQCFVSDDARELGAADMLILPGVGNFAAGRKNLIALGLWDEVARWASEDRPMLGICLGMQLLFEHSDEGDLPGLGVVPGKVERLSGNIKVPHMGWNQVDADPGSEVFKDTSGKSFYFVHSYVCRADPSTTAATAHHGERFAAAIQREKVCGVQFHPEKSGRDGLDLLRRIREVMG